MAEKRLSGGRQRGDFTGHASLSRVGYESAFKLIMTRGILKMPDGRTDDVWDRGAHVAGCQVSTKEDSIENIAL